MTHDVDLRHVMNCFSRHGVRQVRVKALAGNDNSKNQIYVGPSENSMSWLPYHNFRESVDAGSETRKKVGSGRRAFYADLDFHWMDFAGQLHGSPHAKIICYPQYPEVRLSGFLRGCRAARNELLTGRQEGRWLILGVSGGGRVLGSVFGAGEPAAVQLRYMLGTHRGEMFTCLSVDDWSTSHDNWSLVATRMADVCSEGWIPGKRLTKKGVVPSNAVNSGGYTLEAELGISANGSAKPDLMGWEVKAHAGKPITLFTPNPDGGVYQEERIEGFMERYGYPAVNGTPNRINYGGIHRTTKVCSRTGHRLRIEDGGSIHLEDARGDLAAAWSEAKLSEHWNRKHQQAVYVDYEKRLNDASRREFRYEPIVHAGRETSYGIFLDAVRQGAVYLDPGLKLIRDEAGSIVEHKTRFQFRIHVRSLPALYEGWSRFDLAAGIELPLTG